MTTGRRAALPSGALNGVILTVLLAACGVTGTDPTIPGEIDDDSITLERTTAPQTVWLELTNVGSAVCELTAVLSETPHEIPVVDGRAELGSMTDPAAEHVPILGYTEVDGAQVAGEGAAAATVPPGSVARMQLAFTGIPDRGERVILCNGAGDYEAGRYAVLAFDR